MISINLFDKNKDANILLAGIIALIIGVGLARFAFTSLLPYMLIEQLSLTFAGVLASVNFAAYLSGSIFAVFIKDIQKKVFYFRIGLILAVFTTYVLAFTTNEYVWLLSRIVAGFAAAMSLVVGSAIVMSKLKIKDKTKSMGIHFSGIGFSILIPDLITRFAFFNDASWMQAWLYLAVFGSFIIFYPLYILDYDRNNKADLKTHKLDKTLFSPFVLILIIAYFTEGVGFVIQATFLPDIINSLEGLDGYGGLTWLIVGFSGIFSCVIWMRLASTYGYVNIIIISMLLQTLGVLIPTFTNNLYLNIFSGVLYGGTFVGLVALFMSLGGRLANDHPVILMGALSAAYGIGQVIAPLYAVVLTDWSGSYDYSLYLTASIILFGAFILLGSKKVLKISY